MFQPKNGRVFCVRISPFSLMLTYFRLLYRFVLQEKEKERRNCSLKWFLFTFSFIQNMYRRPFYARNPLFSIQKHTHTKYRTFYENAHTKRIIFFSVPSFCTTSEMRLKNAHSKRTSYYIGIVVTRTFFWR